MRISVDRIVSDVHEIPIDVLGEKLAQADATDQARLLWEFCKQAARYEFREQFKGIAKDLGTMERPKVLRLLKALVKEIEKLK